MAKIDWDEYKEHKKLCVREDKLEILIDFVKSYYNMYSVQEMYDTFKNDDIAVMMLDKRSIGSAEDLEKFLNRF